MRKTFILFLLSLSLGSWWSCRSTGNSEKLAEVDGTVVTRAEIDGSAGKELRTLRQQLYRLERQKLDEHIGGLLLTREAKERGVSVATLLEQEINNKVPPISEEDIRNFYDSHKDRLPVEFEKVRDQIRDHLHEQRVEAQKIEYLAALRSRARVTTYLKAPEIYRASVSAVGAPVKGSANAPVTMVKFEDFHCPFCRTVQATLSELLKRYDGKLRLVHKDLPLDALHPEARQAAEAARCAGDQGKFWEYHDALYGNAPRGAVGDLKNYAKQLELEQKSFDDCLDRGKYKAAVQKDVDEAVKLGLTGTPGFFINGRELSGAQPIEAFAAIIDDELARAQ
jgi:protein-disulfide isomerase